MTSVEYDGTEIALIGMAGRFPGAKDVAQFWENLRDGVDTVRRLNDAELAALGVPADFRADPDYVPVTAQMPGVERFDAPFFGFDAQEAAILDPQQRILLELAWEALESAGHDPETDRRPVGVFAGASLSTYLLFNLSDPSRRAGMDPWQALVANSGDSLATRVSYKLNLKGPSFSVQSACSTSLVAVHLACGSLLNDECDLALAGAVSIKVNLLAGYLSRGAGMLSPEGRCRSFDAGADGMFFGHGGGVVVLKRLTDALADGDPIRAVIRGSAVNNDGNLKVGYAAPSVEGQAEVLTEAWSVAGIDPGTLSYIEAHGTGTRLGDTIEIKALARAFHPHTARRGFCALGSVKTNIGHLDAAAGVASLIKTVLALEHRQIPPSLHFVHPSPEIDFGASPVRLVTELADWPAEADQPRRAGVSSFGLGGTNAHLVVEEAPRATAGPGRPWDLLTLSARSAEALERATDALAAHLAAHPDLNLSDVAFTLQLGRRAFPHRRALVCRPGEDAAELLRRRDPERVFSQSEEARDRTVAFLIPGAADVYPGMGGGLYRDEPVFRREVDRCADLLAPRLGHDVRPALLGGDSGGSGSAGGAVGSAVPLAFTLQYALARLWLSWGVRPAAVVGRGVGEEVAACLSGTRTLEAALALVAEPARAAEDLAPEGPPEIGREPGRVLLEMGTGALGRHALEHQDAPQGAAARALAAFRPADDPRPDGAVLLAALAHLWLLGVRPDWTAFHTGERRRRVPLPTYPFEGQRYWLDAPGVPRPLGDLDAALRSPD
ncbi:MAG TPA: type I polyketide synthase [Thermoanaerobaculia bacterium]|nr:type I polyketide synthase [Thermoanaerobaculia bacterium]